MLPAGVQLLIHKFFESAEGFVIDSLRPAIDVKKTRAAIENQRANSAPLDHRVQVTGFARKGQGQAACRCFESNFFLRRLYARIAPGRSSRPPSLPRFDGTLPASKRSTQPV